MVNRGTSPSGSVSRGSRGFRAKRSRTGRIFGSPGARIGSFSDDNRSRGQTAFGSDGPAAGALRSGRCQSGRTFGWEPAQGSDRLRVGRFRIAKPFGAERSEKASGSVPCGHDAKTASEHLAPSSMTDGRFPTGRRRRDFIPPTRNGTRHILAGPRRQRQLMHHRVCAPVRSCYLCSVDSVNCMLPRASRQSPHIE